MIRLLTAAVLALPSLALPAPAHAAERNYSVTNFERLRVYGPFRVILTTDTSPGAKAQGEPRATDLVDIRVEGDTLTVRAGSNGWGEQARSAAALPVIRLSTRMLRTAMLTGSGDLTILGPVKAQKVVLLLSGSGALHAAGVDTDQVDATAIGSGSMTLGGRAAKARLSSDGPGGIQAGALVAGDLSLHADGSGDIVAQARFTAAIAALGIGSVTVYGKPSCTLRGAPKGPVNCGAGLPPAP